MTVKELIELLQQMPQDLKVEVGVDSPGQTELSVVSLENSKHGDYVFLGDY